MPELYGIYGSHELSPEAIMGFAAIQRDISSWRAGRAQCHTLSWARTCTVSWHDNDPVAWICAETPAFKCAWIGVPPRSDDGVDCGTLVWSVCQGEGNGLGELDPPFAACVVVPGQRSVRLISDPFGLHPIYYACQGGMLVFCTKLLPLLRSNLITWDLDERAVLDFFTYEHVTGNRTFADSVRVLPPATILSFADGAVRLCSYTREEDPDSAPVISVHEAADGLYQALDGSVTRAIAAGGRIGVTLSGGLDSRALLGLAMDKQGDVRAYTFGSLRCRDAVLARQLAVKCGIPHTFVEIGPSYLPQWLDYGIYVTGGMVNCIHYHILSLAEVLASEVDVVLDGLGGDALTGAHLKWGMVLTSSTTKATDAVYRQRATAWATQRERVTLFQPDFLSGVDYDPREALLQHSDTPLPTSPWRVCHRFDIAERQRRFIQYGPHLLRPLVGVQTPFYGAAPTAVAARLSLRHLLEQRAYLLMHSKHLSQLAHIPDSNRGLPVSWPQTIRFGKKVLDFVRRRVPVGRLTMAGESPTAYVAWFRDRLGDLAEERLLDCSGCCGQLIQRSAIERLLREHREARDDHSIRLGCLLTFASWYQSVSAPPRNPPS